MFNILMPMSGKICFESEDFFYPKPLIEINSRPLIEYVVNSIGKRIDNKKFIFIVNTEDCRKFHLDNVLQLLTEDTASILKLDNPTRGAACSALMAIAEIDNDTPLIVSNSDHIIDYDLSRIISTFEAKKVDAGVVCFDSIHPKWSFARVDENNKIIETAEKRPLSRNAIAGFYYFSKGSYFVRAAKKMIKKDANVNGLYYIAPTLNELVLENMNLEIYNIPTNCYYNFYSPHKIREIEFNHTLFNL